MIKIKSVSKSYVSPNKKEKIKVLDSISLNSHLGEIVSIYGSNGSGKSTLLKIICGIIEADEGEIEYGKEQNKFGFVWQNYSESLFPWLTVTDNIELPLKLEGKQIKKGENASKLLMSLGFSIPQNSYTYKLSGGQQQMVAIARALSNNPSILLLDEPFSALDRITREQTLSGLRQYCLKQKPTVFFVSHSIDEAILFGDLLVLLSDAPGHVIKTIKVKFEKPRSSDLLTTERFVKYRNEALSAFK